MKTLLSHSFKYMLLSTVAAANLLCAKADLTLKKQSDHEYEALITLAIDANDSIDKNSITLSVDNPNIQISTWKTSSNYTKHYDPTYREDRKIFNDTCTISALLSTDNATVFDQAYLHLGYYSNRQQAMVHEQLACAIKEKQSQPLQTQIESAENVEQCSNFSAKKAPQSKKISWSDKISALVEGTESTGIRILLVFLLGLLMSLTPCIYPMIPITVGILQAHGSKNFLHNLLLAIAYTVGIATTFALLGLTAAFTGQLFGSIMSNPIFIIGMVAVLIYLGFSMLGFYNMYTPRFMSNSGTAQGGSLTAAFLFGTASGTVASPCLSPGLILLLSIVTTLGSKLLGFVLLFAFGVGLSLPLLIIGTFSTSLMLLPRAGMWMEEIKKIFGLLLFGMCFYFLNTILPWPLLLGLASTALLASGIFYLRTLTPFDSKPLRLLKNMSGITFVASALFLGLQTYQSLYYEPGKDDACGFWTKDYYCAKSQAEKQHQALFIDIGAPYCSTCKAIDRTILSHPRVIQALQKHISVKIDAAEQPDVLSTLQEHYTIKGVPTLLLVNHNGELIKQWGGEIYNLSIDEFVDQLNQTA